MMLGCGVQPRVCKYQKDISMQDVLTNEEVTYKSPKTPSELASNIISD